MRYIRLAILLFVCVFTATSATTVSDTIYLADGTGFAGSLVITWSSFATSTGTVIAAGTITETVTNGVVSIDLEPYDSYTVRYYQGGSKSTQIEYWTVPVSATAVTIASIRSTSVPTASMAVAISALTGGTTKGDLAVYNGSAFVRLGAGVNGKALIADSTSATGLNWGSIPAASTDLSDASSLAYTTDLTDKVSGASSLTTQYSVPYVSSSGVLANGPLLYQCSSGVIGIGGCTNGFPGLKTTGGTLYLRLADDSSPASVIGMNMGVLGRIYSAGQTVTYSATPAFNASLYNTFKITLTGDVTSSTLSGAATWQIINFLILQDATGNHPFVWPPNFRGGMTIGSGAGAWSLQSFIFDGTNAYALSSGVTGT